MNEFNLCGIVFEDKILTLNLNRYKEEYMRKNMLTPEQFKHNLTHMVNVGLSFGNLMERTIRSQESQCLGICVMTDSECDTSETGTED